jgi:hypothetical protein
MLGIDVFDTGARFGDRDSRSVSGSAMGGNLGAPIAINEEALLETDLRRYEDGNTETGGIPKRLVFEGQRHAPTPLTTNTPAQ